MRLRQLVIQSLIKCYDYFGSLFFLLFVSFWFSLWLLSNDSIEDGSKPWHNTFYITALAVSVELWLLFLFSDLIFFTLDTGIVRVPFQIWTFIWFNVFTVKHIVSDRCEAIFRSKVKIEWVNITFRLIDFNNIL